MIYDNKNLEVSGIWGHAGLAGLYYRSVVQALCTEFKRVESIKQVSGDKTRESGLVARRKVAFFCRTQCRPTAYPNPGLVISQDPIPRPPLLSGNWVAVA